MTEHAAAQCSLLFDHSSSAQVQVYFTFKRKPYKCTRLFVSIRCYWLISCDPQLNLVSSVTQCGSFLIFNQFSEELLIDYKPLLISATFSLSCKG